MLPLSRKQAEVLRAIERFARREGRAPSVRELGEKLGRSAATVQQHLAALVRKGLLRKDGTAHGLALVKDEARARGAAVLVDDGVAQTAGAPRAAGRVVPLVGRIAAGAPIEAIAQRGEELVVPGAPAGSFALRVRGDSMVEDHILDGDLVIVRPAKAVGAGAIAVCLLEDGCVTLKRVYKERGRVRLQPANAALRPLYVRDVEIQGQVFAIWRRL